VQGDRTGGGSRARRADLADADRLRSPAAVRSRHRLQPRGVAPGYAACVEKGRRPLCSSTYPIPACTVATPSDRTRELDVHLLQGNLRRLDGGYRIEPQPNGSTQITWQGLIEPGHTLPAFIHTPVLPGASRTSSPGMVREIERRADLGPRSPCRDNSDDNAVKKAAGEAAPGAP